MVAGHTLKSRQTTRYWMQNFLSLFRTIPRIMLRQLRSCSTPRSGGRHVLTFQDLSGPNTFSSDLTFRRQVLLMPKVCQEMSLVVLEESAGLRRTHPKDSMLMILSSDLPSEVNWSPVLRRVKRDLTIFTAISLVAKRISTIWSHRQQL